MDTHWFKARISEMTASECRELLQNHEVGRLAYDDDHGPMVMPVNYTVDGEDVLIATSAYGSIARSVKGHGVAFEIDGIEPASESGWSVVVRGRAEEAEYLDLPVNPGNRPYPWAEGARTYIVRIRTHSVSGRRLIPV